MASHVQSYASLPPAQFGILETDPVPHCTPRQAKFLALTHNAWSPAAPQAQVLVSGVQARNNPSLSPIQDAQCDAIQAYVGKKMIFAYKIGNEKLGYYGRVVHISIEGGRLVFYYKLNDYTDGNAVVQGYTQRISATIAQNSITVIPANRRVPPADSLPKSYNSAGTIIDQGLVLGQDYDDDADIVAVNPPGFQPNRITHVGLDPTLTFTVVDYRLDGGPSEFIECTSSVWQTGKYRFNKAQVQICGPLKRMKTFVKPANFNENDIFRANLCILHKFYRKYTQPPFAGIFTYDAKNLRDVILFNAFLIPKVNVYPPALTTLQPDMLRDRLKNAEQRLYDLVPTQLIQTINTAAANDSDEDSSDEEAAEE
jgi:hypothetical protein